MDISSLAASYRENKLSPSQLVEQIYERIEAEGECPIWITVVPKEQSLARARELESLPPQEKLPLYGIPFAVKDNIDIAGMLTTAACPAYSHQPSVTARVVQRLLEAGAILIGKTNMDQFATGLVGTRTPFGICSSIFHKDYISGGSSSGSAVAVAKELVSFSLGTDTAGSGRVPAAFNQLVGLKPTRGWLSSTGLVPACKTLDCISIFAETCSDAAKIFEIVRGYDDSDSYSRIPKPGQSAAPWIPAGFRFGVPRENSLKFFGDEEAAACYKAASHALTELGGEAVVIDYESFRATADLLYKGPWVAERLAAIKTFVDEHLEEMDPTVGQIISSAKQYSAVDAFQAAYRLEVLRAETEKAWKEIDFLLLPTAPTHYTIAEIQESPLQLNSNLGYYTNFVNLLDLAAVAIPAGMKPNGLPFGVSVIGKAFTDDALLMVADRLHRRLATTLGGSERLLAATPAMLQPPVPPGCVLMAVVGAHLSGQPLNWQLKERKARLLRTTKTRPDYRFYVLPNSTPQKPGLIYEPGFQGPGVEVEVWAMPEDTVGTFIDAIPAPLSIGTLHLEDGSKVKGFLCEPAGVVGAQEITHLQGWRNYLNQKS